MTREGRTSDESFHTHLINVLATSDYGERYLRLCRDYPRYGDVDASPLPLAQVAEMFRGAGVEVHLDKRFRVFSFDPQDAAGWTWQGKLVVQKYNRLEPMFSGRTLRQAVGSTMLDLALDAGDRHMPPVSRERFLPPHPNRPRFDGDLRTMEHLVHDLVALTRWMRELVAETWTIPPDRLP